MCRGERYSRDDFAPVAQIVGVRGQLGDFGRRNQPLDYQIAMLTKKYVLVDADVVAVGTYRCDGAHLDSFVLQVRFCSIIP